MYLGVSIHQKSDKFLKKTKHFSKCLSCFLPRRGTQQKDLMVFENTNAFELKVPAIKNPSNIPNWSYGFVVCQKLQSNHSHFKLNKEYADYLLIYRHRIARFVYVVKLIFAELSYYTLDF